MRFHRFIRVTEFTDTSRKRAAFARSQRLQREKLPLFAGLIAEEQHDVDTEVERRAYWWPRRQQTNRDRHAANWKRARARFFALSHNVRRQVAELWRTCPYPASPEYLLSLLAGIEDGSIDLDAPPWRVSAAQRAAFRDTDFLKTRAGGPLSAGAPRPPADTGARS